MPQSLSLPRKIALVLLPCVGALVLLSGWQYLALPEELPEGTRRAAKAVLMVGLLGGGGLCLGFVRRLRRQLRTRSRYLLWTLASVYFLGAIFIVLRFGRWSFMSGVVGVICVLALGLAIWGATAERQRTIEYTLFPRRPKKPGQGEGRKKPVKQGA